MERQGKDIEKIKAYGLALHKKRVAERTWKRGKNKLSAYTVEGDEKTICVYGKGGYLEIPTQKAEALALMIVDAADDAAFMARKKKQAKTIKYVTRRGVPGDAEIQKSRRDDDGNRPRSGKGVKK